MATLQSGNIMSCFAMLYVMNPFSQFLSLFLQHLTNFASITFIIFNISFVDNYV